MRFRYLVVVDADTLRERDAAVLPDRLLNAVAQAVRSIDPEEHGLDLEVVSVKPLEDQ
jgi:hypothetical protein